jgi:hypothetical protein
MLGCRSSIITPNIKTLSITLTPGEETSGKEGVGCASREWAWGTTTGGAVNCGGSFCKRRADFG